MEFSPFVQGIIIGLTLAVPVGPISLICIRRAIAGGRLHGIAAGLGVATADTWYAVVAVLGLTIVSGFIVAHQVLFRAVAGIALMAVGIRVFREIPSDAAGESVKVSYPKDYLSLLAITLANPMTLLFFLVVLPGFGIIPGGTSFAASAEFVFGIFCGSSGWWIVLCGTVGSMRSWFGAERIRLINRTAGILIVLFGIATILLVLTGQIA